jgi:tetratricopeptide (TPR) repeat protein
MHILSKTAAPLTRFLRCCALVAAVLGYSLLTAGAAPSQSAGATVEQLWAEASAAQQAQQYVKAASLYRKILALQPDIMEAEVNLGLMLHLNGDLEAAIDRFQHVLARRADLFVPNFLTGMDYLKLGNPSHALPYLQKASDEKPDQFEARVGLANSYLQLRRYPEALEQFRRATELNRKSADAWSGLGATYLSMEKEVEAGLQKSKSPFRTVLLGQSYLQQGRVEKAADTLSAVVAGPQAVLCAPSLLGFAYLQEARYDDAARQFLSDWDPRSGQGCLLARLGMASVDADRGNTEDALRELREAASVDSAFVQTNSEFYWNHLAKAGVEPAAREILAMHPPAGITSIAAESADSSMKKGNYSACSNALSESPLPMSVHDLRILSLCSYYAGRDDVVLTATGEILKRMPADAEALYWRVQSAERLGLAALTMATNINPDSASLHALLGDMHRAKGDLHEAADEYRKAIAAKPGFLAAHLGLARELYADHNTDDAEREVQFVLNANPGDPEANYLMGEILVNRLALAEALPFLLKALQVSPEELPYVHADLSTVYEERGDFAKAIAEMKRAVMVDVDGSYFYRLGHLYMKTGDRAAAAQALEQSAKLRHATDAASQFKK